MASFSLTDRSGDFPRLLAGFEQAKISFTSVNHLPEAVTTRSVRLQRMPSSLKELDLSFFRRYEVFPTSILTFHSRWQIEQRGMQVGDTILQQACLPPISGLSVKIIMGVRIIEVVDTEQQFSFTYATLDGHLERGTATWIAHLQSNDLKFVIQTHSQPANALARLAAPLFSLRYQAWVAREALANSARQFAQRNPDWAKKHRQD